MSNLLKAYRKGKVKHVGTILCINLHTLFTSSQLFLGRAKKVIMIALQLHMVTQIEFQTWKYFSNDDDEHYYECVLFDLFFEHIAPCLRDNPHNIAITYDTYYKPQDDSERKLIVDWNLSISTLTLISMQILDHLPPPFTTLIPLWHPL